MALTEEEILQQINVLTKLTSDNPDMIFKASATRNTALNPDYFSGQNTKIVNAINKLASDFKVLEKFVKSTAGKSDDVLMDVHTDINGPIWEETKELMGAETIIEGINKLLKGEHQHNLLGLTADDIDKILVVKQVNDKIVVAAVDSHDEFYHNDEHEDITSVGQAIDVLLDHLDSDKQLIIDWDKIQNKPEILGADSLVLSEGTIEMKAGEDVLSSINITVDSDIDEIISGLN